LHVFLSYARSSEAQAQAVERTLTDEGYAVWRDSELPAHLSYAEVIEERLNSAKAVLVLWSAEAAKSQWVRAEADAARERGTLVQSSVDGTVPPIPFNQIQCADLKGWAGEGDHAGWRKLHASIVALAGQAEEPAKAKAARARKASSICILPFLNKSPDDVPDYFCEGLSEDITTDLGKAGGIAVTPLKKALAFKGQDADPADVAEKLGVAHVLLGAVLKAGNKVRITTQLIDGATGEPMWSDRYHRDFSDILSIQDEITQEIVAALKTQLIQPEPQAIEEEEPQPAKAEETPRKTKQNGSASAFKFDSRSEPEAEQAIESQSAAASLWDKSFDEGPEATAEEDWSSNQEYYADDDEDRGRGFNLGELGPRIIGAALVAVIAAVLIYFYWPSAPKQGPVVADKDIAYQVIADVNVRSLPSRYNSRILGTLDKGATINIVPDLAGAQPDWVKIKDGPYVGGYVWRESTRPVTGNGTPTTSDTKPRKDVTG